VQAVWTPPAALNDVFTDYIVVANSINTYSATNQLEPRQWMFPNSTLKTGLPDLHPGTLYNISVATHSDRVTGVKISDIIWTEIGGECGRVMSNVGQVLCAKMYFCLHCSFNIITLLDSVHVSIFISDQNTM
jgi:hypothetical protein